MNPQNALISALIAEARKDDGDEDARRARIAALLGSGPGNPILAHLVVQRAAEAAQAEMTPRAPAPDPLAALRAELAVSEASLASALRRIKALELQLAACRKRRLAR